MEGKRFLMKKRFAAAVLAAVLTAALGLNVLAAAPTVQEVEHTIDQIGTVTRENRKAVEKAVEAYSQLDNDQKSEVSNFGTLAEAQQILGIQDAVAKLKVGYDKKDDAVILLSPYTEKNEKNDSCTVAPVLYASDKYSSPILFLFFEYLGSDYLQTQTVRIKAGGSTYQYRAKDFAQTSYGTIKLDGKTRAIERGIRVASRNDVKVLSAMLADAKTTIQFVGKDKTVDYVLSNEDRQAITDVLYAYDLMNQASADVLHKVLV